MPRLKTSLRIAGVGLSAAAALTVLTCLFWPMDVAAPTEESNARQEKSPARQSAPLRPTLKQLEAVWEKPLRRPLVDPQLPTTTTANVITPQQALPNVRLLGIALESGHSFAIFAMPQGVIELRRVGETLGEAAGGPQIASIDAQQVVIRFQGRQITVPLEDNKER